VALRIADLFEVGIVADLLDPLLRGIPVPINAVIRGNLYD
jgi:hypothetical protein